MFRQIKKEYFYTFSILNFRICLGTIILFLFSLCGPALKVYPTNTQFSLIDQNGNNVSDSDLKGKNTLLFFAFTRCPSVCPNNFARLKKLHSLLGYKKKFIQYLMITVDPSYDTSKTLKNYLKNYNFPVKALTGKEKEIQTILKNFHLPLEKKKKNIIHHSSRFFLLDKNFKLRYIFNESNSVQFVLSIIRTL